MLSGRIVVGSDNWDQLAMLEQIVRALAAYKDFLTVWNDADPRDPERSQSRVREGAIARRSPTSLLAVCHTLRNQVITLKTPSKGLVLPARKFLENCAFRLPRNRRAQMMMHRHDMQGRSV